MMTLLNRLKRDEDGQAIVIAAVGLLIMAIGVIATAQIGFAVYERQKLQTIADAQAYSLATMHARAFNFIAFTNRAMVAHFVAMMHMQGIISVLTLMEAATGVLADLMYTAYGAGCCPPYDIPMCWLAPIAPLFENARANVLTPLVDRLDPIFKQAIDMLFNLNRTVYYTAQMTFVITLGLSNVFDQIFNQVLNKIDKDIDIGVSNLVTSAANTIILTQLFENDAMSLPNTASAPGTAQGNAQVITTEVSNASRVPENMLTKRSMFGLIGGALGGLDFAGYFGGSSGQSKMITYTNPEDFSVKLPNGSVMTSKDMISMTGGSIGSTADITVLVQNDFVRGKHVRYARKLMPAMPLVTCNPNIDRFKQPYTQDDFTDSNHGGWNGIGPFITLKSDNVKTANKDFGQHGLVVWLNKKTEKLIRPGLTQKFTLHAPNYTKSLDTSIAKGSTLTSQDFRGLNAIATAQVYYHRPGNWREMPNLFNPFWKARLYPVADWLNKWVVGGIGGGLLPPEIMQLLTGYIIVH